MLPHIKSASDLVTSQSAVVEGFLKQAIAKTNRATPYVKKAKVFWTKLQQINHVEDLLQLDEFHDEIVAVAGFSGKAMGHLSEAQLRSALQQVFKEILSREGADFRESILYRYLLTKGASLGGEINNCSS